jgi:hypothetical protein
MGVGKEQGGFLGGFSGNWFQAHQRHRP